MRIRVTRLISAAFVVALGVLALRRSGGPDAPVAPGTWEPVE